MEGLDQIIIWKMDDNEAETYKVALLWEKEINKFKDEYDGEWFRRTHMPRSKDPRESSVFRHCWKMRRETRGLIEPDQVEMFIKANVAIVRHHKGRIFPEIITGDKAWLRWKVWWRMYQTKLAEKNHTPPPPVTDPKIMRDLLRTKRWIFEKFDGKPTIDKYQDYAGRGIIKMWALQEKISPFYVALSPWIRKICDIKDLEQAGAFDISAYEGLLTDEIRQYFEHEFPHEV